LDHACDMLVASQPRNYWFENRG